MAALEAEKYLAEQEGIDVPNGINGDGDYKQGKSEEEGDVPEYRQNPLL